MPELEEDEQLLPLSEEERPTLGARIAGTAPPPVIAAAPDAPPPMPKPNIDMSKMPDAVKMLTGPASIPTPPTGSNNPQLADLAKKQATLSAPINPVDPATHKTKPEYRMGIGQRILGTIANAATGFEGRGGDAVRVGPGATNNRFAREEAQRQGELSGVNTQIGTQQKMDTENERMYRDAIRQAYESQIGQARIGTSEAQKETADVRQELAKFKTSQGPTNKVADETAERTEVANKMGLKGEERKSYILTGKLPGEGREPRQPTELDAWMSAFKRDNGRPPTADEIANRKANKPATRADFDKVEQRKTKALKDAEKAYNKAVEDIPVNDVEGRKQALSELNEAKDAAQQGYVNEIQTLNDRAPSGQTAKPASAQSGKTAGSAAASKIDPKNLPQQVMVGGKLRKVAGYNQQTGKVVLAPEGQ
jgi:hypothetical protein